jgi:hypothetical protein
MHPAIHTGHRAWQVAGAGRAAGRRDHRPGAFTLLRHVPACLLARMTYCLTVGRMHAPGCEGMQQQVCMLRLHQGLWGSAARLAAQCSVQLWLD